MSLVTSDQSSVEKNTTPLRNKTVFYRLYGDIVEELNKAVVECIAEGKSQADIARDASIDPATLSRILTGRAGTNLRSISCVLAGTDHRLKVEVVSCKHLNQEASLRRSKNKPEVMVKLILSKDGTSWTTPNKNRKIERLDKQFSDVVFIDYKDKVFA